MIKLKMQDSYRRKYLHFYVAEKKKKEHLYGTTRTEAAEIYQR